MVTIITGATHSGKTLLAQKLLNKYHVSYISIDHIKMGLVRSGFLSVPNNISDKDMTEKIWPVIKEIIKTAIENKQNLIIEGCYIPFTWKNDFDDMHLKDIKFICLCFSKEYIIDNYNTIRKYGNCIENRIDDSYCTQELLINENERFIKGCDLNGLSYKLINDNYEKTIEEIIQSLSI